MFTNHDAKITTKSFVIKSAIDSHILHILFLLCCLVRGCDRRWLHIVAFVGTHT
jgi:hypothetical protein